jgi:undecaprenyl-diphosphatase
LELIHAIFLGIMQGLFEWLPISSQGQIAALSIQFFGVPAEQAIEYAVLLHAGTLLSAIVYFRKEISEIIQGQHKQLRKFIFIAVLATTITALPSYLLLKSFSASSVAMLFLIAIMLLVTGAIQKKNNSSKTSRKKAELNSKNSVILGLAQGFSALPGISRSGVTTAALLFEGFSPEKAFRISFLLSIPSVLLAELAFGTIEGFTIDTNAILALAFAFLAGIVSIHALLKIAKRIDFSIFCIAFGLIYLAIAITQFLS